VKAIDWNVLDGCATLSVLPAAEGYVVTRSQVVASDLQGSIEHDIRKLSPHPARCWIESQFPESVMTTERAACNRSALETQKAPQEWLLGPLSRDAR